MDQLGELGIAGDLITELLEEVAEIVLLIVRNVTESGLTTFNPD